MDVILQSMNVVEQPEFRELLLYCGQGALKNKDIPHHDKITTEAHEMYMRSKAAIMREMKVRTHTHHFI
jgi:hypothetical protein